MINRLLILLSLWFCIDLYFFQAVWTAAANLRPAGQNMAFWSYWLFDGALAVIILFYIFSGRVSVSRPRSLNWIIGFTLLSLLPKLVVSPILILEDAGRLLAGVFNWLSGGADYPGRTPFVSMLAVGVAAIPFTGILYGMTRGKYQYRVHRVRLAFPDLPPAFHGFTITQLSDIHAGSFDNKRRVEYGVELANRQKSDLLVFTGDLVNHKAEEMAPWIETFGKLQAPYGKFSVFGNHDYGDYLRWPSLEAKSANLEALKAVHSNIGFQLLLNTRVKIEKDGQSIHLIGVENWGKGGFAKYGDLNKAAQNLGKDGFNILLSHDPSHWRAEVLHHDPPIHLTLSGHTHGMQFGIEIPGLRWSPIKYVYPQWAGIYEHNGRRLYVNRGFGFLAFPARVGILPEVTVITLERLENNA